MSNPLSRSNSSSGHVTPVSGTPARGSGGGGGGGLAGGRLRIFMRGSGGGTSGSRPQSPYRGHREDGAAPAFGGSGGDGGWGGRAAPQHPGLGRADSGRWSNHSHPNAGVDAPTAPYRGEDGVSLGKRGSGVIVVLVLSARVVSCGVVSCHVMSPPCPPKAVSGARDRYLLAVAAKAQRDAELTP